MSLSPAEPEVDDAYLDRLCEISHDAYESAAIEAGWETNPRSRVPWAEVPEANKATMRASVDAVRREILRSVYEEICTEVLWQEEMRKRTNHIDTRIARRDTMRALNTVWGKIRIRTGVLRP